MNLTHGIPWSVRHWRMSAAYALVLLVPLVGALLIAITGTNVSAFHAVQRVSHWIPASLFDSFWESATYAGDGLAVVALASLLLRQRPEAAMAGMIAAVPAGLLTRGAHAIASVDRPPHVLTAGDLTVLGPALHHGSFPSGHAVAAGLFAGAVFLAYRSAFVRACAIAFALLVAISRSAVGVHWPLDTLVGLASGWMCAWVGWQLVANASWTVRPQARVVTSAAVSACGVALLFHPAGLDAAAPFRYVLALVSVALAATSLARSVRDWSAARSSSGTASP